MAHMMSITDHAFVTYIQHTYIHVFKFIKYLKLWLLPYFFGYKTEFFSFQNKPKDLDPSYKTDLDLWKCLGRVKLVLQQNFIGQI